MKALLGQSRRVISRRAGTGAVPPRPRASPSLPLLEQCWRFGATRGLSHSANADLIASSVRNRDDRNTRRIRCFPSCTTRSRPAQARSSARSACSCWKPGATYLILGATCLPTVPCAQLGVARRRVRAGRRRRGRAHARDAIASTAAGAPITSALQARRATRRSSTRSVAATARRTGGRYPDRRAAPCGSPSARSRSITPPSDAPPRYLRESLAAWR